MIAVVTVGPGFEFYSEKNIKLTSYSTFLFHEIKSTVFVLQNRKTENITEVLKDFFVDTDPSTTFLKFCFEELKNESPSVL